MKTLKENTMEITEIKDIINIANDLGIDKKELFEKYQNVRSIYDIQKKKRNRTT